VAGGGVVSRDDVLNDAVRDALATVSARVAI